TSSRARLRTLLWKSRESGLRRGVVEAVGFRFVRRRALHLLANPHIDRKRNRDDHHNTDSQDEKPPEHPHNVCKDSRCAPANTCAGSQINGRSLVEVKPWPLV